MTTVDDVDVVLGEPSDGLAFTLIECDASTGDVSLLVRLTQPGLVAEQPAYFPTGYSPDVRQLDRFVQDMAKHWRGWSGDKEFSTLEGELKLTARHDGHIRLEVQLRGSFPKEWRARTTVTVEPGEQLGKAGRDMTALVQRCGGSRRWFNRG